MHPDCHSCCYLCRMKTFAEKAIGFHRSLRLNIPDSEVQVMNPFRDKYVMGLVEQFYKKFFNDNQKRSFILGINPGRFGAGITGISFTDPVNLHEACGIQNHFDQKHELSSVFIYDVIDAFGGVKRFYQKFFVTAVSPLGFVKDGKNINYYDEKELQNQVTPFIRKTLKKQVEMGARQKCAVCVGGGKNFKYLHDLNKSMNLFEKIIPVDHPRFVMQYRRKSKDQYVKKYLDALNLCELLNNP